MAEFNEIVEVQEGAGMHLTRTEKRTVTLSGQVTTIVRRANGAVEIYGPSSNLVVTVGKALIIDLIDPDLGSPPNKPKYIALGTGTTEPSANDTALEAEITTNGGARTAATASQPSSTTLRLEATFNITGNLSINETGVFNASSSGTMLARALMPNKPLNLANGDTLTQRWEFTVQ